MKFIAFLEIPSDKISTYLQGWRERLPDDDKVKVIIPPHIMPEPYKGVDGYIVFEADSTAAMIAYLSKFEKSGAKVRLSYSWEEPDLVKEYSEFLTHKKQAEEEWAATKIERIRGLGTTSRLEILPLVDWHKSREDLSVETGVSYLIKTDENCILFDLGLNSMNADPSPLLQNMEKLGIHLEDVDTIVISHPHGDHVGGGKWLRDKTFSLTGRQIPLTGKEVYTPMPMTYPRLTPIHSKNPTKIGKGVTTTGTIARAIFSMGLTPEQALAVNVEGKGIVLVIGCGHQTLPRILKSFEDMFEEPLYGIVGGLHYPVEGGPVEYFGTAPHRFGGTGKPPWEQITKEELQASIDSLKQKSPKLVALSPHDSSPMSLEAFRKVFGAAHRELRVGDPIII